MKQRYGKAVKFYDINLTEDALEDDSLIALAVSLSGNDNEVNLSTENSQIEGVIVGFEDGKVAVRVEGEMRFKNGGLLPIPSGVASGRCAEAYRSCALFFWLRQGVCDVSLIDEWGKGCRMGDQRRPQVTRDGDFRRCGKPR